jgi:hypothetical protein
MGCPHCLYHPHKPEADSQCALTGLEFPSPWFYDEDYGTGILDDFWFPPQCPLPVADSHPPTPISWADYLGS